jgi:hypothetical protein
MGYQVVTDVIGIGQDGLESSPNPVSIPTTFTHRGVKTSRTGRLCGIDWQPWRLDTATTP